MKRMKRIIATVLAMVLTLSTCTFAATTSPEVSQREKENADFTYEAATQGMVLMENNGVLPIAKSGKIALFGPAARLTVRGVNGSGAVNSRDIVSVEQGFENAGYTITTKSVLDQAGEDAGCQGSTLRDDIADIGDYITAAKSAGSDYAVYVIGRTGGEGSDRPLNNGMSSYDLTDNERANIEKISAAFDKTIVVLNVGGVMDTKFYKDIPGLDALVLMGYPGMRAGDALVSVLNGTVNPSGKLTDTWAINYSDYPSSAEFANNDGDTGREYYKEDIYVGYRYFDTFGKEVAYPFGFGMSYTQFELQTDRAYVRDESVAVNVTVKNIGTCSGREVVQVYFSAPSGTLEKPYQELAAYGKTRELAPGESQSMVLTFPISEMSSYSTAQAAYILEKGNYVIRVGNSSRSTSVAAVLSLDTACVTEQLSNQMTQDVPMSVLSNLGATPITYPGEQAEINGAVHIAIYPVQKQNNASIYDDEKIVSYVYPGSTYTKAVGTRTTTPTASSGVPSLTVFDASEGTESIQTLTRPSGLAAGQYTLRDVATGRISMTEFVADLSPEELCNVVCGNASSDGLVPGALENQVRGSAGSTTGVYYSTRLIPNLPIADGPAGLRLTQHYTDDDEVDYYQFATRFPNAVLLAMTWDPEIIREYGVRIGQEMAEFGVALWIGPALNIHRNPLGGRNGEYYSEDPLVSGLCAAYATLGAQSQPGVGAALKHFACNNQETNRNTVNNTVSERALREIYLKGYEIAVKMAQPMAMVNAYNRNNGYASSDDYDLNTDILRGEWGFKGLVMTDWGGGQSQSANSMHAGCDLIMAGGASKTSALLTQFRETKNVPLGDLQKSAAHILNIIMQTQQFEKITGEYPGAVVAAEPYSEKNVETAPDYGHVYVAKVVAPTCTEGGRTVYTCACGDSFTSDYVAALGHNFVEGVCTRCGMADPNYESAADRTALDAAIAEAEALKEVDYTPETFVKVKQALAEAKALPDSASQTEVDAAAAALNAAMDALEAADPFRFEDVKDENAFYFIPVYWAYNARPQITNGLDLIYFGPNNSCTRGQVVTFLWRAAGCPAPESTETAFTDVKPGAFYEKAVAWAVEKGITNGMSETSFAPDATCTRGQIVTFLWRFKGKPESAGAENPFTDVAEGAFYYNAVLWAVQAGVTNGMSPTTFAPNSTCTRGQIVTFLYRAMNG